VTPEEERLILSLVIQTDGRRKGSPEEVLRHFGTTDGPGLGLSLLCDAVDRRDGLQVEMALIVCYTFGFTTDHLDSLVRLCFAEWHVKHEDVVSALGQLRMPESVDALYHMTQWIPDYLDYDESRALATKAIWALGGTPGPQAEQALVRLLDSNSEILREGAEVQLQRRQ
jgi:hypothetical protein